MNTIHFMTLPEVQAIWFAEICQQLGIFNRIFERSKVLTVCRNEDREAAWQLFREDFQRKILN